MAKIKVKFGANEVEIDSRDFYVDNHTVGNVIESLSKCLSENSTTTIPEISTVQSATHSSYTSLASLADAETFESEFDQPRQIEPHEIRSKLSILESARFFDSPRTVTETVEQLREYGWETRSLDVSKALAKMASGKEILKNSEENHMHYFVASAPLTN